MQQQPKHVIYPDVPQTIITALKEYNWSAVAPDRIQTMLGFMGLMIAMLPQKPLNWQWNKAKPTFDLRGGADVPQAAFDHINRVLWENLKPEQVKNIISQSREYFQKQGIPSKQLKPQNA